MRRLLTIDDSLTQLAVIGRIGANLGFDVMAAPSFDIAVELIERNSFDVITLELSLNGQDGVKMLRLLADRGMHAVSLVIISGCDERVLASAKRIAEGLRLSLSACLEKPINLDRLKEALSAPTRRSPEIGDQLPTPDITAERIARGLAQDEFSVEFQPKVDLATGKVVGAEALARWHTPEIGFVPPTAFVPIAEQSGLISALTSRIISLSVRQAKPLIEHHPEFTIAVNISATLMSDLTLPEQIEEILRTEGVPGRLLIVEITETAAMSDIDRAIDILVRLRLKNIRAAIDDFGTGYSSLAVLARLPFSELKIDQSFVRGCGADPEMMKIIDASVGLARAFNMKVVVEGVEDQESLWRMRRAGCDIGQGHLFAPALKPEDAADWIRHHNLQVA